MLGVRLSLQERSGGAEQDPLVGLDVCGTVRYCRRSTLVNASPYFEGFFRGGCLRPSLSYRDPQGRDVYFVERPPTVFPYIFDYIVSSGTLALPDFHTNPTLVQNLRTEAEFFGLQDLYESLKVVTHLPPNRSNQGVLHWLGTNKGTGNYENPCTSGAIDVTGWMDKDELYQMHRYDTCPDPGRASFVQYRERLYLEEEEEYGGCCPRSQHSLLGPCNTTLRDEPFPVILDLKKASLRPTHYSIRAAFWRNQANCAGMHASWELSASQDGFTWDTLHNGIGDKTKVELNEDDGTFESLNDLPTDGATEEEFSATEEEFSDIVHTFLEEECRDTWALVTSKFYRYFRITRDKNTQGCLHGEGIEFFGDVYA